MKLTMDDILLMNALEKVTGAQAKDCISEGQLVSFLVPQEQVGKAIGKAAANIKQLEAAIKKRVEIVPYFEKPEDVLAGALEVKVASAKQSNGKIIVNLAQGERQKAFKNNARLRRIREFVKRSFGLELLVN